MQSECEGAEWGWELEQERRGDPFVDGAVGAGMQARNEPKYDVPHTKDRAVPVSLLGPVTCEQETLTISFFSFFFFKFC